MTDANIIRKLLEEKTHSLACANDIAHWYETIKNAARAITQMMRPGLGPHSSAARTALVQEDTPAPIFDQPQCSCDPFPVLRKGRQKLESNAQIRLCPAKGPQERLFATTALGWDISRSSALLHAVLNKDN